jgi:Leucine-rich repeat (LRR) protein
LSADLIDGELKSYRCCEWVGDDWPIDRSMRAFEVRRETKIHEENFEIDPKHRSETVEEFYMSNSCGGDVCDDRSNVKFLPVRVGEAFPNLVAYHAIFYDIKRVKREHLTGMKKLEFLGLRKNLIYTVDANAFEELVELKYLSLDTNKLESLSPRIFNNNGKLKRINLFSNQLRSVTPEHFAHLTGLTHLSLCNNQLTSLDQRLFTTLVNLQELSLCNLQISSLPRDIFATLSSLQNIHLQNNNRLTTLDEDIFSGNRKLRDIKLGQGIRKLSPKLLENKPDLSYVDLRFNPCINKAYGSEGSTVKLTSEKKTQLRFDVLNGCS